MTNKKHTGYKLLLGLFFFVYLIQYFLDTSGSQIARIPVLLNAILYVAFFVLYLVFYRKENLLCFELMAVPVAFLGLFFDDIIYPLSSEAYRFFTIGNDYVRMKSEDIQMAAFFILLLGLSVGNDASLKRGSSMLKNSRSNVSYDLLVNVVSILLLIVVLFDFLNGTFSTWFYYSNSDWMEEEERNLGLGHLTCILLADSCLEIVRLREKKVDNLKTFFLKSNKLFIIEWLGISALLYITGNRNEMLLVLLPLIVGYTICIRKIPNRILITTGVIGVVLMVVSGMTRQQGLSFSGTSLNLLSFTRDFANLGYNTDFLIEYTDKSGTTNFVGLGRQLLSGIPYLGNVILQNLNTPTNLPISSATLCTESTTSSSGLGTSLIGDLYYSAGFVWVIVYLFIFGYIMSVLYHSSRDINIYWLLFYMYNVANAVYYVRSSWAFPITIIEYSLIIIFLGQIIFKKQRE